jgi:uncharacterized integral membrane protein
MRQIRWFLFVMVSVLVALFGLSNLIPVRINFLFFTAWINMPFLIVGTFALGALVGLMVGLWHDHKARPVPKHVSVQ